MTEEHDDDDTRTVVFDTETNGKRPKVRKGQSLPPDQEPAITQIAAMLFWGRRPVAHLSCFIDPLNHDGTPAEIPREEFFIKSGITQETVDAVGLPNKVGIAMFSQLLKVSDRMVAHNIAFDCPITRAAFQRVNAPLERFDELPKFCTMKTLEPILKLPGKYGYKFPTLDESYRALVDPEGFDGAHDAMVDVEACAKVLWAIEDGLEAGDERFFGQSLWQL